MKLESLKIQLKKQEVTIDPSQKASDEKCTDCEGLRSELHQKDQKCKKSWRKEIDEHAK